MITVLTSGVALGVHVPGLLLVRRLREAGVLAAVEVLEELLTPEARARIPASKVAFHRDFRVALAGQRLARDVSPLLDEAGLAARLARWRAEGRRRFVVLSGFWIPVLDRYAAGAGDGGAGVAGVEVDLCHVDSVRSPSFRRGGAPAGGYRHRDVWLLDAERGTVPQTIPVTRDAPVPWGRRAGRYLAHGGGWGMGTYGERARELAGRGLAVDVVAYERADGEAPAASPGRTFLLDPAWHPWDDDGFPPFGELRPDGGVAFARSDAHHGSFDLARRALAMVSKPGGGTLLDSLAAATPVVLLEPFGDHEARNAELWLRLGFGVAFDDWWRRGCPTDDLEARHRALLAARARVPSYAEALAAAAAAPGERVG